MDIEAKVSMLVESKIRCSKMKTNSRATTSKMASVNSGYINIKHMQQMHIDNCDGYHKSVDNIVTQVLFLVFARSSFPPVFVLLMLFNFSHIIRMLKYVLEIQTKIPMLKTNVENHATDFPLHLRNIKNIVLEDALIKKSFADPKACLLQMQEIQDVCCEFLKQQLHPSNCLGIRAFADTHSCRDLLRIADKFTQHNFQEVMESEEFMELPVNQLMDIISSDELNVRSEEQVFSAVMAWVKYNVTDRRPFLAQVLEHVRLPLLSPKFLVGTVGSDLLIKSDEACRDLVDEAKNYLLLPQERPLMQGPRTRPRKPIKTGEVLFAVGGWCSGDAIASVERFEPTTCEWRMVAPMSKRRCGVGVAVLADLLYAVGGHDGQSYLNSVERYQTQCSISAGNICKENTVKNFEGYLYKLTKCKSIDMDKIRSYY
ncbi:unnamed protein product, partial [Meganyctiphanes norvegica]